MNMWKYNPNSLRILQISPSDQGGGAESSAINLWKRFRELGHQSWLAVGQKTIPESDPDLIHINNDIFRSKWTQVVLSLGRNSSPSASYGIYHKLIRFASDPIRGVERRLGREDFNFPGTWHLLEQKPDLPDVIHCHNLHGGFFDLRALPKLSRKRPLILNLRDSWLLSGHCAYSLDCTRWITGCGKCPDLTTYPGVPRDATTFNWRRKRDIFAASCLYITAVSQWLMDRVNLSMLKGVKQRVIYNGINTNIFSPGSRLEARRKLGLPDSSVIILFTAHSEFKDYQTMVNSLERLTTCKGEQLLYICVGKAGSIQQHGQGTLMHIGRVSSDAMVDYYRATNVFIHAAKDEAFGKTITESLACETPVVATDVGGIPEQIRHRETGFLTPPSDPIAMSEAISTLIQDDSLQFSMGKAGRANIVSRFSLDRQVNDFLNWYGEILQDWEATIQNGSK